MRFATRSIQDLAFLKLGQEAEVSLSYLPDRKFKGRITYIYPIVDEKTRTAGVRMEFHNPGLFLKPGMFATVQVRAELEPSALLDPASHTGLSASIAHQQAEVARRFASELHAHLQS